VDVAGARTVVNRLDVTPGESAVLSMTALPLGADVFTALAYPLACGSVVAPAQATWISNPSPVTLVAGAVADVSLTLVPNGQATVGVGFAPDDAGAEDASIQEDAAADAGSCTSSSCGAQAACVVGVCAPARRVFASSTERRSRIRSFCCARALTVTLTESAGQARQPYPKRRPFGQCGPHVDVSAVRNDELARDVEAQAQARRLCRLAVPLSPPERAEKLGSHSLGDGGTLVVHGYDDLRPILLHRDRDGSHGVAIVDRVADEIREYLFEAVTVP
jgi:hypothetical protein